MSTELETWRAQESNPTRKIHEFILAWRLEKALSKKRIVEFYLNVVEWGDGIFGADDR
jgi:monofunctional biosynthetic peptidoglycan transglycosylase